MLAGLPRTSGREYDGIAVGREIADELGGKFLFQVFTHFQAERQIETPSGIPVFGQILDPETLSGYQQLFFPDRHSIQAHDLGHAQFQGGFAPGAGPTANIQQALAGRPRPA